MDRKEAVALLKEMTILGFIQLSFVSIDKSANGTFIINLKANGKLQEIRAFLADKDLICFEDDEKGIYTIYSP